ncbi:MAG TPA: hypothetical protein VGW36_09505, partial [Pyrinomonadaceae bacterium]|nr:hypothetical protein [Pyrinomonadaceae bacterium]
FSKIPIVSDIPILGALFKSKSFQKSETELMFIVTAQLVKPLNRDDIPQMRGIDGLKNGSPLGVEPKSEGIQGRTGLSVPGENAQQPAVSPKPAEPVKSPAPKKTEGQGQTDSSSSTSAARKLHPVLPVARSMPMDFFPALKQ